jgi:Lar family restriction alleviation protein
MMDKIELRPCPFCGSEEVELAYLINGWSVLCSGCLALGSPQHDAETAIEAWNLRRPYDQRAEILRQAIDELLEDVQPLGEYRCGLCGKRECSH